MFSNKRRHHSFGGIQCGDVSSHCCPPICPTKCKEEKEKEKETISTGPLPVKLGENRVEFLLTNPTNKPEVVTVTITTCGPPSMVSPTIAGTVVSFTSTETVLFGPTTITVPARSCFEGGVVIPPGVTILDAIFTGPFEICDCQPAQGGLEASVAVGIGVEVAGIQLPGISGRDVFVPFGAMVLSVDC